MKIKPTTIHIDEEPYSGHIHIRFNIEQPNGQSSCGVTIKEYALGRKVEAIAEKILEVLKEYKNDGTLEE